MELHSKRDELTFRAVNARLLAFVKARIQDGEFSERSLARRLGVSQPQLHNVLKGARKLRIELADELLAEFRISVLDLLTKEECVSQSGVPGKLLFSETGRLRLLRKEPTASPFNIRPKQEAS